jgi:hypothetical protein
MEDKLSPHTQSMPQTWPTERGDRGWKEAQRQGDFMDNFNYFMFLAT